LLLVLLAAGITGQAQSIGTRKVSCAFQATRLDEVIRHLSQEAGVSFIYSSNKTNLSKVVTLSVENQSLEETLNLIGAQLDVEFKMQGRFVMIKQQATEVKPMRHGTAGRVPLGRFSKNASGTGVIAYYPASNSRTRSRVSVPIFVERQLPPIEPTFTRSEINSIPLTNRRDVSALRNRAGLFFSAGTVLNDYSSGIELQAGIRSAYLVFTPTWMSNGKYHSAIGLGTSIPLGKNLALTPVYLLGQYHSSSTMRWRNTQGITEMKQTEKAIHHQVKLMIQYTVTPAFVVKLGPTINQSNITYSYYQTTSTFIERRSSQIPGAGVPDNGNAGSNITVIDQISSTKVSPLAEQHVRNAWLGWEASIALKLNFSKGK